jgi:hypothetical protein
MYAEFYSRGRAIYEACDKLPDGWQLNIVLESDGASVELLDCEGNEHTFPSDHERLSEEIRDAMEYAVNWQEPDEALAIQEGPDDCA